MKTLQSNTIKLGNWDNEVQLRTDPAKLAKELNIDLEIAVKLSAMEVLTDNRFGENKSTFKIWNNKRVYFRNSVDSNRANGKQRYWDLENNELMDYGLSNLDLANMKEALKSITVDTFYK